MSASEKLRALERERKAVMASELKHPTRANAVVLDALPLITDVVEAAEREDSITHPEALGRPKGRLHYALTALREHLEGQ